MFSLTGDNKKVTQWPNMINVLIFHLVWLLCVTGNNVLALAAVMSHIVIHKIAYVKTINEWFLIGLVSLIGFILDSVLLNMGLIMFSGYTEFNIPLTESSVLIGPVWLACLWVTFSTTLCHGFFWLSKNLTLASIAIFLVVPVSYFFGSLISESVITNIVMALLGEAIIWAVLFPSALLFAKRINQSVTP